MEILFPVSFVMVVLGVTLLLTFLVIQPPLFRASRFRPGDALRYQ
jgi:ABC-type lipoprotein release transport system permease subunit